MGSSEKAPATHVDMRVSRKLLMAVSLVLLSIAIYVNTDMVTARASAPSLPLGISKILKAIDAGLKLKSVPSAIIPTLGSVTSFRGDACMSSPGMSSQATGCSFGDKKSPNTVVIYGDSFAEEWIPALAALGSAHHFKVLAFGRYSCPFANVAVQPSGGVVDTGCATFRRNVVKAINALNPAPALVLLSEETDLISPNGSWGSISMVRWTAGMQDTLRTLHGTRFPIGVILGTPTMKVYSSQCLSIHVSNVQACSATAKVAFAADDYSSQVKAVARANVSPLNVSYLFCNQTCPTIINGNSVFQGYSHINSSYVTDLATALGSVIGCSDMSAAHNASTKTVLDDLLPNRLSKVVEVQCQQMKMLATQF
jgi:hypothetical protein